MNLEHAGSNLWIHTEFHTSVPHQERSLSDELASESWNCKTKEIAVAIIGIVLRICSYRRSFKMSSMKSKRKHRARTQRLTSNIFAMFNQAQIQEFKEAFNMIDQNRDGYVDKDDLQDVMISLGKDPHDDYLQAMINEAPGPINFTMFLTLFGDKLNGTDPEDVIRNAFACFDEKNTGKLSEEYLRECLTTMGDRWTDEMVDDLFHGAPISGGLFDYIDFTRTLKHGAKEKDDDGLPNIKPNEETSQLTNQ